MSNPTTSGASSVLDDNDVSVSDLVEHVQSLTDRNRRSLRDEEGVQLAPPLRAE
ncbi:hypothetical protein [Haladaptatus caseinilyticus]|uniref:hypothetical protein n=1 Tax=Haladaptatus caseinilyticus TaxID=2993314 RepID=UPI00224A539C|nr:hypothetical protein [Haladaptatus caseinilyticus]